MSTKITMQEPFIMLPLRLLKVSNISMTAKVLYSHIYYSSANEGCLTNSYLSNTLNISARQITRYLKELKDNGYIECKEDKKNNRRIITPLFTFDVSLYRSASDIPDNTISDHLQGVLEDEERPDNINFVNTYGNYSNIKLKNGEYTVLKGSFGLDRLNHYIDILDEKIEFGSKKPNNCFAYLQKLLNDGSYDDVELMYPKNLLDDDKYGGFRHL